MPILDIILIIVLAYFFFSGLRRGLIRTIGSFIGIIIGLYVASHYYSWFYEFIGNYFSLSPSLGNILAFFILFFAASKLTHFIFYLIEKAFNLLAFIPGSKYINNLLGAVLGTLEGALLLGAIFYFVFQYLPESSKLSMQIEASVIIPWLRNLLEIFLPVFPKAIKAVSEIF